MIMIFWWFISLLYLYMYMDNKICANSYISIEVKHKKDDIEFEILIKNCFISISGLNYYNSGVYLTKVIVNKNTKFFKGYIKRSNINEAHETSN